MCSGFVCKEMGFQHALALQCALSLMKFFCLGNFGTIFKIRNIKKAHAPLNGKEVCSAYSEVFTWRSRFSAVLVGGVILF